MDPLLFFFTCLSSYPIMDSYLHVKIGTKPPHLKPYACKHLPDELASRLQDRDDSFYLTNRNIQQRVY